MRLVVRRSTISARTSRTHSLHRTLWSVVSMAKVKSSWSASTMCKASRSLSIGHLSAGPLAITRKRFSSAFSAFTSTKLRTEWNRSSSSTTRSRNTESSFESVSSVTFLTGIGRKVRAFLPPLRFFFLFVFLAFFGIFFGGRTDLSDASLLPKAGLGNSKVALAFLLPRPFSRWLSIKINIFKRRFFPNDPRYKKHVPCND